MTRRAGSALLLVLLLLAVLVVVTAEIATRSSADARVSENRLTEVQAGQALQGALVHAWGVLAKDQRADQKALDEQSLPMADWAGEDWAQPVTGLPLGDGTYGFAIADETARFPLDLLDAAGAQDPAKVAQVERLLEATCTGMETAPFLEALGDWTDADATGLYETFDPPLPAPPPNRSLLTLKECLLVPTATTSLLLGPDGKSGLLPRGTLWGQGRINLNTAPREVLYALSPLFTASAYAQIEARRPFRTLDELDTLLGLPDGLPLPPELSPLDVRSDVFRVSLSFTKGNDTRTATAVIARGGPKPVRIAWDPDPSCP